VFGWPVAYWPPRLTSCEIREVTERWFSRLSGRRVLRRMTLNPTDHSRRSYDVRVTH
jgi:hypothetical protein